MRPAHILSKFENQYNSQEDCSMTLFIEDFNNDSPRIKEGLSMELLTSPLIRRGKNEEESKLDSIEEFFFKKFECNYIKDNDRNLEKAKIKNCACNFIGCGKKYLNYTRLQIHQRSHQKLNQFKCGICEKEFNEKGNLKIHSRVHTGDRPFTCSFLGCIKKFKTKGHLSDHNRTHYKVKAFSCEICYMPFRLNNSLKAHIKTHSGDKPFFCTYADCAKTFSKKGNLKIHLNSHHKKSIATSTCTDATTNSSIFSEKNQLDSDRVQEKKYLRELQADFTLSASEFMKSPSGNISKNVITQGPETVPYSDNEFCDREDNLFEDENFLINPYMKKECFLLKY